MEEGGIIDHVDKRKAFTIDHFSVTNLSQQITTVYCWAQNLPPTYTKPR